MDFLVERIPGNQTRIVGSDLAVFGRNRIGLVAGRFIRFCINRNMVVASLDLYCILRQFLDDCLTIFRDIIQRRICLTIQFGIHITGQITDSFADRFTGDSTLIIRFYFANSNLFREFISFVSSQVGAISIGFSTYRF